MFDGEVLSKVLNNAVTVCMGGNVQFASSLLVEDDLNWLKN